MSAKFSTLLTLTCYLSKYSQLIKNVCNLVQESGKFFDKNFFLTPTEKKGCYQLNRSVSVCGTVSIWMRFFNFLQNIYKIFLENRFSSEGSQTSFIKIGSVVPKLWVHCRRRFREYSSPSQAYTKFLAQRPRMGTLDTRIRLRSRFSALLPVVASKLAQVGSQRHQYLSRQNNTRQICFLLLHTGYYKQRDNNNLTNKKKCSKVYLSIDCHCF